MTAFDLFSIGHSNIPPDRFIALQREAGVTAIADVRSTPFSRFCPWFSAKNLAPLLAQAGIGYSFYGAELGGRPSDPALYRDGIADFEAMARQPEFHAGLDRLVAEAARNRLCMMCSEREPLECHRCLLIARTLAARGLNVGHILHDGSIEPHAATERRLVALDRDGESLFVTGQQERLAAAYLHQARAVAYRGKTGKGSSTGKRNPSGTKKKTAARKK
ncbi:MAG TPA: DUF488 domain-containing protein [Xanthobacteraceae bacterium]|nr:DUF488 domain-containing protein [Xanthobacteraceae bacterium]